jgi:hypothetical protein
MNEEHVVSQNWSTTPSKHFHTWPLTKWHSTSPVCNTEEGPQIALALRIRDQLLHTRLPLTEASNLAATINEFDEVYRRRTKAHSDSSSAVPGLLYRFRQMVWRLN